MVEPAAVNRVVVGSSPTRGARTSRPALAGLFVFKHPSRYATFAYPLSTCLDLLTPIKLAPLCRVSAFPTFRHPKRRKSAHSKKGGHKGLAREQERATRGTYKRPMGTYYACMQMPLASTWSSQGAHVDIWEPELSSSRGNPSAWWSGSGDAAWQASWTRSGECARASHQTRDRPPRACADDRRRGQNAAR